MVRFMIYGPQRSGQSKGNEGETIKRSARHTLSLLVGCPQLVVVMALLPPPPYNCLCLQELLSRWTFCGWRSVAVVA